MLCGNWREATVNSDTLCIVWNWPIRKERFAWKRIHSEEYFGKEKVKGGVASNFNG